MYDQKMKTYVHMHPEVEKYSMTHHKQCNRPSNRGKQRKVNTSNIQTKLQVSREISKDTSPRQVLSPALTMGFNRVHLSLWSTRQTQKIYIPDNGTSKKPVPPELPIVALDNLDYIERQEQAYHIGRNERPNIDEYSELSKDATEHI